MSEHRTKFDFKDKSEFIIYANMPDLLYPNQHIDTETRWFKRDHVIVPNTVKFMFNLDNDWKNVLILGSQKTDAVKNTDIYIILRIFNWVKKIEEKLLQGIQSALPRWNPPWRGEGAYLTKRFQPVYQQKGLVEAMLLRSNRRNGSS